IAISQWSLSRLADAQDIYSVLCERENDPIAASSSGLEEDLAHRVAQFVRLGRQSISLGVLDNIHKRCTQRDEPTVRAFRRTFPQPSPDAADVRGSTRG